MAGRTSALQVGVAAVNVVIFILAFTSIYPFPAGDFNIDLPSPNEVLWDYQDGLVTVTAPFSIDNGGFYDVQDLTLDYSVVNYSDQMIAEDTIVVGTMKAGTVTASEIVFEFDLVSMYERGITWMVFNDDLLDFTVEVSCSYTMRLVKFEAIYSVSIPWDALIQDVSVTDVRLDPLASELLVDYRVTTSDLLSGSTMVIVTLYENGTALSQTTQTVALGTDHAGTLSLDIPLGSVPDTAVLEVTVADFYVEQSFSIPSEAFH
ncbi:MAG: hypothetical protein JSV90_01150 [Methanobacteriota archaeon]|nr:MAG: hypothetical protein JSV90_01150 [Euryarchaeota archaeon]